LNISGVAQDAKRFTYSPFSEYVVAGDPPRLVGVERRAEELEQMRRLRDESAPRRRRGYGTEHYAAVARVYINALYYTGKPTKAVADEWMVAKSTAAKWVRKARDLKLLGETRRGKSGGIRPEKEEEE
jgi:hypothetical protein